MKIEIVHNTPCLCCGKVLRSDPRMVDVAHRYSPRRWWMFWSPPAWACLDCLRDC